MYHTWVVTHLLYVIQKHKWAILLSYNFQCIEDGKPSNQIHVGRTQLNKHHN